MAYIGKQPTVGNFVKLDTITTSATTTFNLTNGGVAYYPQSPNHCLVSLNGILQAPTDSFTISGSTIIFSSALTTSDVIDFIIVLGDVLNIGTPSDNTVSLAKLTATGTKDSTTFLRGDNTFAVPAGGTNTPAFYAFKSDSAITSGVNTKLSVTEVYDTDSAYDGTKFTVPSGKAGKYLFFVSGVLYATSSNATYAYYKFYKNNSLFRDFELYGLSAFRNHSLTGILNLDLAVGDYIELYAEINGSGTTGTANIHFGGFKLVE